MRGFGWREKERRLGCVEKMGRRSGQRKGRGGIGEAKCWDRNGGFMRQAGRYKGEVLGEGSGYRGLSGRSG